MTPLQQVRANIDDYPQIGFTTEESNGEMAVYQLNSRNYWDLTIKDSEGATIESTEYEEFPQSGQIKGELPEGTVTFEYTHSGFTDAEIEHYLSINENSVVKASLACVKILLASSAKRFDYKAGIKDIKASQVFDHLKELHDQLTKQAEAEDASGTQGGVFVTRTHPAYTTRKTMARDVSRGII